MPQLFNAPTGRRRAAGATSGRRASASDFGGGEGFTQLGSELSKRSDVLVARRDKMAEKLKAAEERADVTRVQTLQSQALADLSGMTFQLEKDAELGAPGHVLAVKDIINKYYMDRQDRATTERGKSKLQIQQAAVLSRFTIRAIEFQSKSSGAKVTNDFKTGINTDKQTLRLNPGLLDMILANAKDKITDDNGAIKHALGAEQSATLLRETNQQLTVSAVRGYIARDPTKALIDLEKGVFLPYGLNTDDINGLRREARQAREGLRAAGDAEKKKRKEKYDAAVLAEQNKFYRELLTGQDSDGKRVTSTDLSQKVMSSLFLKPFGVGSKASFIKNIELRAKGKASTDFDKSVSDQQNAYLTQIITLKNPDGTPVDIGALKVDILDNKVIDAFGSKGSKNTLIKMLDDRIKGVDTPLSRQQQEIFRMVTTKTDTDGRELTDAQVIQIIDEDNLLKVEGTAGKTAFRGMVGDISKAQYVINAGSENIAAQARIHLDLDDPDRLTSAGLLEADLIKRVGGFEAAAKLRAIADKIVDKRAARLEKRIQEFALRFKGRITNSDGLGIVDSEGDDRYVSFIEDARERAQLAEDDKDPKTDAFALFNSGDPSYIGNIAQTYGIGRTERRSQLGKIRRGVIEPFIRSPRKGPEADPTMKRSGETPLEYFKRRPRP